MTDNTRMTHGIHKGLRMKDVPAEYLLHLPKDIENEKLKKYVIDNQEVLKLEAKRDRQMEFMRRTVKR